MAAERTDVGARMRTLTAELGLSDVTRVAAGLEGIVLRANSPDHGRVAIKVPRLTIYSNANDPDASVQVIYRQEGRLLRHLRAHGFDVAPRPFLARTDPGREFLMMSWVQGDGSIAGGDALGRLVARLHQLPGPPFQTSAQESLPVPLLIPRRVHRRLAALAGLTGQRPAPPPVRVLERVVARADGRRLLHLDLRQVNIVARDGVPVGLLDWSNALIGPPALELARLREISDIEASTFLAGYAAEGGTADCDPAAALCFRLDAAVMLALVFVSEAPDPDRAPAAVDRVDQLVHALCHAVA